VQFDRNGQEKEGLVIEGRIQDKSIGKLLQVYHNSGEVPDAVNYRGKMDSSSNIVTKGYVDSLLTSRIAELEARIRKLEEGG
jgi:hypothetical protein